jgi:hypothetical protein
MEVSWSTAAISTIHAPVLTYDRPKPPKPDVNRFFDSFSAQEGTPHQPLVILLDEGNRLNARQLSKRGLN